MQRVLGLLMVLGSALFHSEFAIGQDCGCQDNAPSVVCVGQTGGGMGVLDCNAMACSCCASCDAKYSIGSMANRDCKIGCERAKIHCWHHHSCGTPIEVAANNCYPDSPPKNLYCYQMYQSCVAGCTSDECRQGCAYARDYCLANIGGGPGDTMLMSAPACKPRPRCVIRRLFGR